MSHIKYGQSRRRRRLLISAGGSQIVQFMRAVAASDDDASEVVSTTVVSLTEANRTSNGNRIIADRFLNIPKAAAGTGVLSAVISYWNISEEVNAHTSTILGFDEDDTAVFQAINANISGRATTTASVSWPQTAAAANSYVDTPELAAIFQEINDRAGFVGGNAMGVRLLRSAGTENYSFGGFDTAIPGSRPAILTYRYIPA